jgi:hypothetical protein
MGGRCGGRSPVRKSRDRWEDVVLGNIVDLLQILSWKATARKKGGWRKEFGKVTDRRSAEVP